MRKNLDPFNEHMDNELWNALEEVLLPCLFKLYAEYIMRNAGLDKAQVGIKIAGEISITSDMHMTPPLWQKVKRT